ncbi:MAG: glycosyltransferase family 2 protein [Acidobacteriota bacterium]|nr:glycosyltransferase family 2 protein [Acidobacteriota bacterium]
MSIVVPTVGASPLLLPCLEALRRDGGEALEILVVDQAPEPLALPSELAVRHLRPGSNLGFTGGVNHGLEAAAGELVGTVNDDLVVQPGWCRGLARALEQDPAAGAAQGVVLRWDDAKRVDGAGLAFNRWGQAVQLGHGQRPEDVLSGGTPRRIFGASATAVLFRRQALEAVAGEDGVFDRRLGSYYEDVDLACRLRAAGFHALLVPGALARHKGSATGGADRLELVYRNRYAVLARVLGRSFWLHLPRFVLRDGLDLLRFVLRGQEAKAGALLVGVGRAVRLVPEFLHRGPAQLPPGELLGRWHEGPSQDAAS